MAEEQSHRRGLALEAVGEGSLWHRVLQAMEQEVFLSLDLFAAGALGLIWLKEGAVWSIARS